MKVSLKQAWEAKGLTGMALREGIRWRLNGRYFKDNPDKARAADNGGLAFILGILFIFFAIVAHTYIPSPGQIKLYSDILVLLFSMVLMILFAVLGICMFYLYAKAYKSAGPTVTERYVFQHGDEEIEL